MVCLAEPEVSQSEHLPLLRQLLRCVTAATRVSMETNPQLSLRAFTVLLRVAASRHMAELKLQVCGCSIACTLPMRNGNDSEVN